MTRTLKSLGLAAVSAMALTMIAGPATATEGLFPNGNGARHKALAGAGIADGKDPSVQSLNPAALTYLEEADADSGVSFSFSSFSPIRKYTINGFINAGAGPQTGSHDSDSNFFLIPNIAIAAEVDLGVIDVIGFAMSAKGGMNTDYRNQKDPFGRGLTSGINYEAIEFQFSFAKKLGPFSIGVQPIVTTQVFKSEGFAGFGVPNNGTAEEDRERVWGYAGRFGVQYDGGMFRVGASYTTRNYNQKFKRYSGLFLDSGDLDLPQNAQAGIAVDVGHWTAMLDYRWINYSGVKSIGDPANLAAFFAGQGISFGWDDTHTIKLGLEGEDIFEILGKDVDVRLGYSYNTNPLNTNDTGSFFTNILAPATIQHHLTAGLAVENLCGHGCDIELAGMFAPAKKVSGAAIPPGFNLGAGTVDVEMYQYEITAGFTWHFGDDDDDESSKD